MVSFLLMGNFLLQKATLHVLLNIISCNVWVIPSTGHACKESWYCFHQNKYPVQDDEYRYHDFQKVQLIEGIRDKIIHLTY